MKVKIALALFLLIFLLSVPGCKTADDTQYTLTVTLAEGVDGSPASGTYQHQDNVVVSYGYFAQSGYRILEVTLDGVAVAEVGSIPMTADHTLAVTSERFYDIRGNWTGTLESYGSKLNFKATFTGTVIEGTASLKVNITNGTGPYEVSGLDVSFNGTFSGNVIYFTGSFIDANHMEGTWEFPPENRSGPWSLTRQ